MKCHYCGEELKDRELFCGYCGTRRQSEPRPAAPKDLAELISSLSSDDFSMESVTGFAPTAKKGPAVPADPEPVLFASPAAPAAPVPVEPVRKESRPAYVPYGAPEPEENRKAPLIQLPTERSLAKMVFLGIITLGIYPLAVWSRIVTEMNIVASRYDGGRTMSLFGAILLTPVTLGIYLLVWYHDFCRRIGAELKRRDIDYKFGAKTFWLWNVLGMLILVGPFVFTHRLMKAMNLINRDFNVKG